MRPSLTGFLGIAMVSLSFACSARPAVCLYADLDKGDGAKVRRIAAEIAKQRGMAFEDESVDPEPGDQGAQNLHFQLAGGGFVGYITARLVGKPLVGINIIGAHTIGQPAWVCFYGAPEDTTLLGVVDDFARAFDGASIRFKKEIRGPAK